MYVYLLLAIFFEIIGTSSLQAFEQFTKWKPLLLMVVCLGLTFFFLSQALKSISPGITYAIWSGVGIAPISIIGIVRVKQSLDLPAIIEMALIVTGALMIQLFSKSATH